jgi:hypothetical protein
MLSFWVDGLILSPTDIETPLQVPHHDVDSVTPLDRSAIVARFIGQCHSHTK